MTKQLPTVDISILLYKSMPYLDDLVRSLDEIEYPEEKLKIYFVNNASPDESFEYVQKIATKKNYYRFIDSGSNFGFAAGHNMIMRVGKGDFIFLVNPDGTVAPNTIETMVQHFVGDVKLGVADCTQKPYNHPKPHDPETGETPWCSGACMMIRKKALEDTGLFDEKFFMYIEDTDLSWRMWSKGWKCKFIEDASIEHYILDLSKHKNEQLFSLNEHYHSFRNDQFMRMIYRGPLSHFRHTFRIFGLIQKRQKITFPFKTVFNLPYRIFRKLTGKRLALFEFPVTSPDFLLFKSLVAQIKYYPHILWRWILQSKNEKDPHIRFYGIKIYDEGTYA